MKLIATKKGTKEELKPARGFIEQKDIKLLIYTNSHNAITKFEVTLGKEVKVFEKDHPFILWTQVENWIEIYLSDQLEKSNQVPAMLTGVGKGQYKKAKRQTKL